MVEAPNRLSSTHFLQITGLGTLVVTPLVGNLSDKYGRKALLTLPMTSAIVPLGTFTYLINCYQFLPVPSLITLESSLEWVHCYQFLLRYFLSTELKFMSFRPIIDSIFH